MDSKSVHVKFHKSNLILTNIIAFLQSNFSETRSKMRSKSLLFRKTESEKKNYESNKQIKNHKFIHLLHAEVRIMWIAKMESKFCLCDYINK